MVYVHLLTTLWGVLGAFYHGPSMNESALYFIRPKSALSSTLSQKREQWLKINKRKGEEEESERGKNVMVKIKGDEKKRGVVKRILLEEVIKRHSERDAVMFTQQRDNE